MPDTQPEQAERPEPRLPKINILALRKLTQSSLKAFVSVKVGPLTLHDFRVIQQPGHRAYVSVPQRTYQDGAGKTKYLPAVEMPEPWKEAIQRAVLEAFAKSEKVAEATSAEEGQDEH